MSATIAYLLYTGFAVVEKLRTCVVVELVHSVTTAVNATLVPCERYSELQSTSTGR